MDKYRIYSLELHEGTWLEFGIFVMRVPGGWLYDCWDRERDIFKSSAIFIPFSNDLQLSTPDYSDLDSIIREMQLNDKASAFQAEDGV